MFGEHFDSLNSGGLFYCSTTKRYNSKQNIDFIPENGVD